MIYDAWPASMQRAAAAPRGAIRVAIDGGGGRWQRARVCASLARLVDDADDAGMHSRLLTAVRTHVATTLGVNLDAFSLVRFGTGAALVSAEGKIKVCDTVALLPASRAVPALVDPESLCVAARRGTLPEKHQSQLFGSGPTAPALDVLTSLAMVALQRSRGAPLG